MLINRIVITTLFIFCTISISAQVEPTSGEELQIAIAEWQEDRLDPFFKEYPVRNTGPVVMGGRITDIIVDPRDAAHYYVGYASGGVFETTNNGITFKPVFDNQGALGIGAMAISTADPDIIWVGTGENNSSRSSYAGTGVYISKDGGKTWNHTGLHATHHIGKVIAHPDNVDIAWIASAGALYSENEERGVYKTTDGGKTWSKTLFINKKTGVIDLIINPENPDQLWAAAWERQRYAWDFDGDGPGSAIYRSDDGGLTWEKTTEGLPKSEKNGRIGLAVSKTSPNIIYAVLDNQTEISEEKEKPAKDTLTLQSFADMKIKEFLALDNGRLDTFLKKQGYPEKYSASLVKKEVKEGKYKPAALSEYFGDANKALFNTRITGAEIYRSEDHGETWTKMNDEELNGIYFTYGYYFGEIAVAPDNENEIYFGGVPLIVSKDGGKTISRVDTTEVHVDHQALWINPDDGDHMLLGNDGGLYVSYDRGANWLHLNNAAVGQFYTVSVDMEKPYNIYGGLQDNGVYKGSSRSKAGRGKRWERIFGGDGMYIAVHPENSNLLYTGFQFGNYYRIDLATKKYTKITPVHDIGEPGLRFNWRTPLKMSHHNPDILYLGAQKVYLTVNKGEDWQEISSDITKNKQPQGNVPYSTITSISESPLKFGLLWAGTDDGKVYMRQGVDNSWNDISHQLPDNLWVSKVCASPHDESTAFISLNGYRFDNFSTHIYKTTDHGKSWTSLKEDLPEDVINVIIQDPVNSELLYAGLDHGLYISLNGGINWHLVNNIPNVAVYDLLVHPRDNELVIATHGRSIYVMDVKPLQYLKEGKSKEKLTAFNPQPKKIRYSDEWGEKKYPYMEPYEPKVRISYYIGSETDGNVTIQIKNEKGVTLHSLQGKANKGYHQLNWDLLYMNEDNENKYLRPGSYKIIFQTGEVEESVEFKVE